METWIAGLDDALWHLESARDWRISQYQLSHPELIVVLVHKYLGLEDAVQTLPINQTKVWFNGVSVCGTMKSKGLEAEQHKSQ